MNELKINKGFVEDILNKNKTAEFRKNDRDFKVGDIVQLQVWDSDVGDYCLVDRTDGNFSYAPRIQSIFIRITHLVNAEYGIPDGYCMFSFKVLFTDL